MGFAGTKPNLKKGMSFEDKAVFLKIKELRELVKISRWHRYQAMMACTFKSTQPPYTKARQYFLMSAFTCLGVLYGVLYYGFLGVQQVQGNETGETPSPSPSP